MPRSPEIRGDDIARRGNVSRVVAAASVLSAIVIGPNQNHIPNELTAYHSPVRVPNSGEAPIDQLRPYLAIHDPTPPEAVIPEPVPTTTTTEPPPPPTTTTTLPQPNIDAGTGLPAILQRIGGCESAGSANAPINYSIQNPTSTASGGYQIEDGTWGGFDGYARALYAPPAVQDQKALELYDQEGTSPWLASESCWEE